MKVVAVPVSGRPAPRGKGFGAVIVRADSPIRTAKDLAVKRVGVNTLKNVNTTMINNVVRKDSGDPSTISFVELPFPEIAAAVAKGDVDAGWIVEPFLTILAGQGDRQVLSDHAGTGPDLTVGRYVTSRQYAPQNAETVTAFANGMKKSIDHAAAHSDEVRAVLSTYTEIDPAVRKNLALPTGPSEVDQDSVRLLGLLACR